MKTFMTKGLLRNKKGFSLIELMVVVMIIGILASVGTSKYQNFIARSKATFGRLGAAQAATILQAAAIDDIIFTSIDDLKTRGGWEDPDKSSKAGFVYIFASPTMTGTSAGLCPAGSAQVDVTFTGDDTGTVTKTSGSCVAN